MRGVTAPPSSKGRAPRRALPSVLVPLAAHREHVSCADALSTLQKALQQPVPPTVLTTLLRRLRELSTLAEQQLTAMAWEGTAEAGTQTDLADTWDSDQRGCGAAPLVTAALSGSGARWLTVPQVRCAECGEPLLCGGACRRRPHEASFSGGDVGSERAAVDICSPPLCALLASVAAAQRATCSASRSRCRARLRICGSNISLRQLRSSERCGGGANADLRATLLLRQSRAEEDARSAQMRIMFAENALLDSCPPPPLWAAAPPPRPGTEQGLAALLRGLPGRVAASRAAAGQAPAARDTKGGREGGRRGSMLQFHRKSESQVPPATATATCVAPLDLCVDPW
eukprot:Hpha_TRINITY_DN18399_c0_g1::TRINITY_DN18399_c0_g1_i1::g.158300::m.158300